ncbi:hypothetical protein M9Y10_009818 [Tritrichomonas musculus]|uniref:pyruvate, phosphate dikinase n=1 Tax=Tritrichomonas musculus TaxID=1915356 RepID=A0ABR2IQL1_9EUKA
MSYNQIYSLSEYDQSVETIGKEKLESILGIKATTLSELIKNDFPVPKGFIISSEAVEDYFGDSLKPKETEENKEPPANEGEGDEEPDETPDSPLSVPVDNDAPLDISPSLWDQILENVKKLEEALNAKFGGGENPLFLCVRPSPTIQIPHILESVFNIGITQESTKALASKSSDPKEIWNSYQETIKNYGVSTANIQADKFDEIINNVKGEKDELEPEDYPKICDNFKELIENESGNQYPEEPLTDLKMAIKKVFDSWNSQKAKEYFQENSIVQTSTYPAVIVQVSILNAKTNSISTRDPTSGQGSAPSFEGIEEYTPKSIENLEALMKKLDLHYRETEKFDFQVDKDDQVWISKFEVIKKPPGIESELRFIVNYVKDGILRREDAINKFDLDEVIKGSKGVISDEDLKEATTVTKEENQAENNVEIQEEEEDKEEGEAEAEGEKQPVEAESEKVLVRGIPGATGYSTGQLAFSADKAAELHEGEQEYIYVAKTCNSEDFTAISQSKGVITYDTDAETSYAAAIATYVGVPCVIGCPKGLNLDLEEMELKIGEKSVHEGDAVTLAVKDDGMAIVFIGTLPIQQSTITLASLTENPEIQQIIQWGDEIRNERRKKQETETKKEGEGETSNVDANKVQSKSLLIYATTDNPDDASRARSLGAEGVGLCNTDQFLLGDRTDMLQKLLIGHNEEEDRDATRQEIEDQLNGEFGNLLETMNGYPVFIRLSDPQIKDYLPDILELIEDMAITQFKKEKGEEIEEEDIHEKRVTLESVKSLYDDNPVVGLRGIRLILQVPGLLRAILRAIIDNCYSCAEKELQTDVYISLPFVTCVEEIKEAKKVLDAIVPLIAKEHPLNENDEDNETEPIKPKFAIASMIEVPRTALIADQIASNCDAIIFNLDILSQQACSIDLNEAETTFLPQYALMHIFNIGEEGKESPLTNIDIDGVGKLLEIGLKKAKEANPNVIVGVAGKQCQSPEAITLLSKLGFDFVSVPVDSLPVVRLAAAKAAIAENTE